MKDFRYVYMSLSCIFALTIAAQKPFKISLDKFSVEVRSENGRIDGPYKSFYKNGNLRASGNFTDGKRTGEWKLWDSTGRLKVVRVYDGLFSFKQKLPAIPNEGPVPLLNKPVYKLERDSNGLFKYFRLRGRSIRTQIRYWRLLYSQHNGVLFENDILYRTITANIDSVKFPVFLEDKFRLQIDYKKVKPVADTCRVVAYKVKADKCFESDRMISEERIISIEPLFVSGTGARKDTFSLFVIYYPYARKFLAQIPVKSPIQSHLVKNLDDYFFLTCYSGIPVASSHLKDYPELHPSPEGDYSLESMEQEVIAVENEHDQWLFFAEE